MRTVYCLIFIILFSNGSYAQTVEIKGRIKDASQNEPLAGVTIYIKENGRGTVTDAEGKYEFNKLPVGTYTLVAKYIGFDSATKQINTTKSRKEKEALEEPEIEVNFLLRSATITLDEVSIQRKRDNETDESARYKEKNGDQVVNIIGARTIEISPDITAANVLQRVSGVTLERSAQGDGRYAILRGMDQRYNNTLINGCKIPSPDPYNRFVPLDIIPSELLQKIEVYKSLTPDMEGDAIGGTVNMEMKDAPDTFLLHVNVFTGYSDLLWNQPFQAFDRSGMQKQMPDKTYPSGYLVPPGEFSWKNLLFSTRSFTPNYSGGIAIGKRFLNNKLGLIFSGTVQNKYSTSNAQRYYVSPHLDLTPYAYEGYNRTYYNQTIRSGFNSKIDYQFNNKNSLSFTNIYVNLQDIETRITFDTSLTNFRTGGAVGTGEVFELDRASHNTQAIETAILNGKHQLSNELSLNWTGLYSTATSKTPDQTELTTNYLIDPDYHHSPTFVYQAFRIWQHNTDKDYTGLVNLEYKPIFLNHLFDIKAGGMYRHKSRLNVINDFDFKPVADSHGAKPVYTGVENVQWLIYSHGYGDYGANNYDAREDVFAYFLQAKTDFRRLQLLLGIRVENTTDAYTTHLPLSQDASSAYITYYDLLPNLQLKYTIDNKQNLRFAIYQSMARPSYFDLVPYTIPGNNFQEKGNPHLEHTVASNIDLRYELFPSANEEILAGVFYKNIQNPIETIIRTDGNFLYNPALTYTSEGTATNYGFEIAVIKYFGHFGFNANYTYTNSAISTLKEFSDTTTGMPGYLMETHSLQGQSKHIANIAALYQNARFGLNIELAYQLTGKRLSDIAGFYGTDYYEQDLSQLDFSADKKIGKHFGAFVKMNNLLNSPYIVKLTNGMEVERAYYGYSYLFGLTYKIN